jgi:putative spermidine/putrescine transport system permease protein
MNWHKKATIARGSAWLFIAFVLLYLMLPTIIIATASVSSQETLAFPPVGLSMRWYERAISYPDFQSAFKNSLLISLGTSTLATALGTAYAYVLERHSFPGKKPITAMLLSPLVIPHFVMGLAVLILAVQLGYVRSFETVILVHVIIVVPFVVRSVLVSLRMIDTDIERAASSLGASPFTVFTHVTLPLLAPGVFGGWLFASILSFTEFSGSLFVSTQSTQPLPVAMFTYIRDFADPTMAALSTIVIGAVVILLVIAAKWFGLASIISVHDDAH